MSKAIPSESEIKFSALRKESLAILNNPENQFDDDEEKASLTAALNSAKGYEDLMSNIKGIISRHHKNLTAEKIFKLLTPYSNNNLKAEQEITQAILDNSNFFNEFIDYQKMTSLMTYQENIVLTWKFCINNFFTNGNCSIADFLSSIPDYNDFDKLIITQLLIESSFDSTQAEYDDDDDERINSFSNFEKLILNNFPYAGAVSKGPTKEQIKKDLTVTWLKCIAKRDSLASLLQMKSELCSRNILSDDEITEILLTEKLHALTQVPLPITEDYLPDFFNWSMNDISSLPHQFDDLKNKLLETIFENLNQTSLIITPSLLVTINQADLPKDFLQRRERLIERRIAFLDSPEFKKFDGEDFSVATLKLLDDLSKTGEFFIETCARIKENLLNSWPKDLDDFEPEIVKTRLINFLEALAYLKGSNYEEKLSKDAIIFLDYVISSIDSEDIQSAALFLEPLLSLGATLNKKNQMIDLVKKIIAEKHYLHDTKILSAVLNTYNKNFLYDASLLDHIITELRKSNSLSIILENKTLLELIQNLPPQYNEAKLTALSAIRTILPNDAKKSAFPYIFTRGIVNEEAKDSFILFLLQKGIFHNLYTDVPSVANNIAKGFAISIDKLIRFADKIYNGSEDLKKDFLAFCISRAPISEETKSSLKIELSKFRDSTIFHELVQLVSTRFQSDSGIILELYKERSEVQHKSFCRILDNEPADESNIDFAKLDNSENNTCVSFMVFWTGGQIKSMADAYIYFEIRKKLNDFLEILTPLALSKIQQNLQQELSEAVLIKNAEVMRLQCFASQVFNKVAPLSLITEHLNAKVEDCGKALSKEEIANLTINFSGRENQILAEIQNGINLLFRKILTEETPSEDDVTEFFSKIISGEGSKAEAKIGKNKLYAFFKTYKNHLALLLRLNGGLEIFLSRILTAESDGCFANMGAQLSTTLNSILIKDKKTALLYGFFYEKIVSKISFEGFDLTHGNIFKQQALSNFKMPVAGFINNFTSYLKDAVTYEWELTKNILGDEMADLLLSISKTTPNTPAIEELLAYLLIKDIAGIDNFAGLIELKTRCESWIISATALKSNPRAFAEAGIEFMNVHDIAEALSTNIEQPDHVGLVSAFANHMSSSSIAQAIEIMQQRLSEAKKRESEKNLLPHRQLKKRKVEEEGKKGKEDEECKGEDIKYAAAAPILPTGRGESPAP